MQIDEINSNIKRLWKALFNTFITTIIIIIIAFVMLDGIIKKYEKDLESTTWYETVATYSYSKYHQERKSNGDSEEYVDYYDWYFSYTAKDGKKYTYIEKNKKKEGYSGYKTKIYVDENEPSRSLQIKKFDNIDILKRFIVAGLLTLSTMVYIIKLIYFYIRKLIATRNQR